MSALQHQIRLAFIAGFRASGEGWNGEWPFEGVSDDEARFQPVQTLAADYAASVTGEAD